MLSPCNPTNSVDARKLKLIEGLLIQNFVDAVGVGDAIASPTGQRSTWASVHASFEHVLEHVDSKCFQELEMVWFVGFGVCITFPGCNTRLMQVVFVRLGSMLYFVVSLCFGLWVGSSRRSCDDSSSVYLV